MLNFFENRLPIINHYYIVTKSLLRIITLLSLHIFLSNITLFYIIIAHYYKPVSMCYYLLIIMYSYIIITPSLHHYFVIIANGKSCNKYVPIITLL